VPNVNVPSDRTAATPIRTRLEDALSLAARGWPVFPGRLTDDDPPKKVPANGKGFKGATLKTRPIEILWRSDPEAYVAVALPPLVVGLDVDKVAEFEAAGLHLPDGPGQKTLHGGYHRLFKTDGRPVRQTVKEIPGADTRVGGLGYLFVWDADAWPDISTSLDALPNAPEWLYDDAVSRGERPRNDEPSEAAAALEAGQLFITRGSRDDRLTSIAGSLIALGGTSASTELALDLIIAAGGVEQPPGDRITPADVRRIARSIASAEESKRRRPEGTDDLTPIPLSQIERREAEPLIFGRLDGNDNNVLFGDGGVGKGALAASWTARLSRLRGGDVVLVLDYERHTMYEWRPRVEDFGGDLTRVFVLQPNEAIWDIADRLHDEVETLRRAHDDARVWLVIDSVTYACVGVEVEKSVTAVKYWTAIGVIGAPSLSLAHTTKDNPDARYPFGSVQWSNGARVTIGMSRKSDLPGAPRILKNRKTNQRAYFPPIEIDWSWELDDGGVPSILIERPHFETVADRAYEALGDDRLSADELLARIDDDGGDPVLKQVLVNKLNARKDRFRKVGDVWGRTVRITPRTGLRMRPAEVV
jgi:hypothetical protein